MTETAADKLFEKYGRESGMETPAAEVDDAVRPVSKSCVFDPVVLLLAFIEEYGHNGFSIRQTKQGYPLLLFNPPLKSKHKDPDRWEICEHAMYLIDQARSDLAKSISSGHVSFEEIDI